MTISGSDASTSLSSRRRTAESSTIKTRIGCTAPTSCLIRQAGVTMPDKTLRLMDLASMGRGGRASVVDRSGGTRAALARFLYLEAAHEFVEFVGHSRQMLGGALRLAHVGRGILRRLGNSAD